MQNTVCDTCGCGKLAVYWTRESIACGFEYDANGFPWTKFKPGELKAHCTEHDPRRKKSHVAQQGTDSSSGR